MEFTRKFNFKPFGYNVHITLTDDLHKAANRLSKKYDCHNPTTAYTAGFSVRVGREPTSILTLPVEQCGPVIAHESFHIVWHLMDWIGAEHEEEVMAYCLDTVVGWVEHVYEALEKSLEKDLDKGEKVEYNKEDDRNSGREVVTNNEPPLQG